MRSSLWPQAYANLTAVDARDNSRITAGALNNPIIYTRAAAGGTVSQLITDFGHTTNLVSSARLQAKADEQNAIATKEDVLLAVDRAFYNALQPMPFSEWRSKPWPRGSCSPIRSPH